MQTGLIIASLRINNNITQQQMADILGISLTSYKLYETDVRNIKLNHLNIISNYFRVSLNYLLNISKKKISVNTEEFIDFKYLKFSLKLIRRRNRINQRELAQEFHMSVGTLSRYENNLCSISIIYLYQFALKFHVSVDYICGKTLKKEIL